MILAFHKPYGVLSQFTKEAPDHRTLAEFGFPKDVYPLGRLDWDSEGLLLLSDERKWTDLFLNPKSELQKIYHAQVEGITTQEAMDRLAKGVMIQDTMTKRCEAKLLAEPNYPPRSVPIRYRKAIPTSWIEVAITEGKNRQVRRMTAAVGFPSLRLIRVAVGKFLLGDLKVGQWRQFDNF